MILVIEVGRPGDNVLAAELRRVVTNWSHVDGWTARVIAEFERDKAPIIMSSALHMLEEKSGVS